MQSSYYNSLSITSQFSFCGLPFRLDTYAGCAFNCTYCFARLRGGNIASNKIRFTDPAAIITKFKNAIQSSNPRGLISQYIHRKMPLHFGGMSDPFQPIEKRLKISYLILEYLCSIQYPLIISTKSNLIESDPYFSVLKSNPNTLVQFSFSTTIDKKAQISEPNATSPSILLKTIEKLSANGIKTSIRWQPYIPGLSESPQDFIATISNTGAKHIGLEHLKLPIEKNSPLIKKLLSKLNFDLVEFYTRNGGNFDARELILPATFKIFIAQEVKKEANANGLTFGAADNELQYLSDTDCCCSGADQFNEFKNWNKFQIAYAIKKSNGGLIYFDSIKNEWKPTGAIDKFINSKSRIDQIENKFNTIEDYIINRWENLQSPFNPTKFFNVYYTGETDASGMKIYDWIDKR